MVQTRVSVDFLINQPSDDSKTKCNGCGEAMMISLMVVAIEGAKGCHTDCCGAALMPTVHFQNIAEALHSPPQPRDAESGETPVG